MAWIQTTSGRMFDFETPSIQEISLSDVSHALGNICRFTGHTKRFYSVAEHSLYVAGRVLELGGCHEEVVQGLLHDAHEAYVGDISSPLKKHLPCFEEVDVAARRAIADRFGIAFDLSPLVERADLELCALERRDLFYSSSVNWGLPVDPPEGWVIPSSERPKSAVYWEWLVDCRSGEGYFQKHFRKRLGVWMRGVNTKGDVW